jgi:hypothetical protein
MEEEVEGNREFRARAVEEEIQEVIAIPLDEGV